MGSIGARGDGFQPSMFQCISPGISQVVPVRATSLQGFYSTSGVTILRFFSTVDCWISFGPNPTAAVESSNSMILPGGIIEYFEIREGERFAVIAAGASTGKLYVTEGATS